MGGESGRPGKLCPESDSEGEAAACIKVCILRWECVWAIQGVALGVDKRSLGKKGQRGFVAEPNPGGPRTFQQLGRVRTAPFRKAPEAVLHTCGAARGPCTPALPQRQSEAGPSAGARARGGGRRAGGGVAGTRRQALPGSSREGRIELGRAPPGGAVCLQRLLPPSPPSSSRPSRGAGRCWQPERRRRAGRARGSGREGSRGRRASVPVFIPSGLCRCARGERDRGTAVRSERQPAGPAAGLRAPAGAMSYQGKKSIPHITVSRDPPRAALCGVGVVRQGRIRLGTAGAAPEAFCDARVGRGRSRIAAPSPQPLGTMGVGGSPAWRGGAGASGPSPYGLAAPATTHTGRAGGWRGRGGYRAEQKREGRGDRTPPSGPGADPLRRPSHGSSSSVSPRSFFPARDREKMDHQLPLPAHTEGTKADLDAAP